MRSLVVALIAAMVAFTLIGCGGDDTSAPAPPTSTATGTVPSDGGGGTVTEGADLSSNVGGYPAPFPTDPEYVPEDMLDRLEAGQPMLVYFMDSSRDVSDDQREQIEPLMEEYRGLIDLVEFDIEEGIPTPEEAELESDTVDPAEIRKGVLLAEYFGILSTPYLILVDREGTITWKWRGFVDESTIERELIYATQ